MISKNIFYKKIVAPVFILAICLLTIIITTSYSIIDPTLKTGILKISFINTANGKTITLRDSLYSNSFGEQYNISKLKYYISNIMLGGMKDWKDRDGYYLMNAASDDNSFELRMEPGNYKNLQFLLGVDSLRNCSGAQTGALDPLNDMFWTWNSGYVMFKLEGTSAASTADLQRIEHHIGGYKGDDNVATKINLDLTAGGPMEIKENQVTEIIIEANLDNYWHSNSDIKIEESPVCMTTGKLAKKIASNFTSVFSIKNIQPAQ